MPIFSKGIHSVAKWQKKSFNCVKTENIRITIQWCDVMSFADLHFWSAGLTSSFSSDMSNTGMKQKQRGNINDMTDNNPVISTEAYRCWNITTVLAYLQ